MAKRKKRGILQRLPEEWDAGTEILFLGGGVRAWLTMIAVMVLFSMWLLEGCPSQHQDVPYAANLYAVAMQSHALRE